MLRDKIAKMTARVAKEARTEVRSYVDTVVKKPPNFKRWPGHIQGSRGQKQQETQYHDSWG
jgi:hypothetical protein